MMPTRVIVRFLAFFVVIFAVLMLPGLRLTEGYMTLFRAMGTLCFTREDGHREVLFQDFPDKTRPTFARIEIANRNWLKPDGSGLVRHMDFNGRGLGWRPTALLIALVLASPLPWGRRLAALCGGIFLMQMIVMGFLAYAIWNESSEIGLAVMSPFWKAVAVNWQSSFFTQFSLAAPVVVWMLVTLRRQDFGVLDQKNKSAVSRRRKSKQAVA